MEKDLNYYLNLPWTYKIEWDDRDNIYVISVDELKGCMSCGDDTKEAINNIQEALRSYLQVMIEEKAEIPEPLKKSDCSGKLILRIPPEKHYKLIKKASGESKSLNKLINEIIDKEVA